MAILNHCLTNRKKHHLHVGYRSRLNISCTELYNKCRSRLLCLTLKQWQLVVSYQHKVHSFLLFLKHKGLAPSNTIPQLSSLGLRTLSDKDKPLKSGCIFAISYCSLLITHSLYLSPFNGMSTSIFQPLTQRLICQEVGTYLLLLQACV